MNGIRRLEELTASNPECISNDVHLVALSLIAEVSIDFFFLITLELAQFVVSFFRLKTCALKCRVLLFNALENCSSIAPNIWNR